MNYIVSIFCITILMYNWTPTLSGMRNSEEENVEVQPDVNIHAQLLDTSGQTYDVQSVAIGTRTNTNKIRMYSEPQDETIDPTINSTLINLDDVHRITTCAQTEGAHCSRRFNHIEYIPIKVEFVEGSDTSSNTYLIEASRALFCTIAKGSAQVHKRMTMSALAELTINHESASIPAHSSRREQKLSPAAERRAAHCDQAIETLKNMEEVAQQTKHPYRKKLQELINRMKDLIGGLCNS